MSKESLQIRLLGIVLQRKLSDALVKKVHLTVITRGEWRVEREDRANVRRSGVGVMKWAGRPAEEVAGPDKMCAGVAFLGNGLD
ncbi:hypothetical protein TIFTF001_022091 [Ficus carica]|uniref:Uncharacterized protein n=1 Tax=Ficus carica TaxID=3494 RepID=A0AA88DCJ6_FICCA|nr:hypothetical protein TIFTF001_022091 [Ficus carica]